MCCPSLPDSVGLPSITSRKIQRVHFGRQSDQACLRARKDTLFDMRGRQWGRSGTEDMRAEGAASGKCLMNALLHRIDSFSPARPLADTRGNKTKSNNKRPALPHRPRSVSATPRDPITPRGLLPRQKVSANKATGSWQDAKVFSDALG